MCGSMVAIQSALAEIRRGKKEEKEEGEEEGEEERKKNPQDKDIMSASATATQGGHTNRQKFAIWAPLHNFVGLYLRN